MVKRERKVMMPGDYTNAFFKKRFNANKNAIIVVTGPTGSGKSYSSIFIADAHYKKHFNKPFPVENICFSLDEATEKLKDRKLQRRELLVLEEMGANMGAADYQSKLSKTFSYILQSFRSMNIGLIMTLPVFTMLNKSARQLCHMILTTSSINKASKECRLVAKEIQLNQQTGKQYWKFPVVKGQGKLKCITCGLIEEGLCKQYEDKKEAFVYSLIDTFKDKTMSKDEKKYIYYELRLKDVYYPNINQVEACKHLNLPHTTSLSHSVDWLGFKEYMDKKYKLGIYAPKQAQNIIIKDDSNVYTGSPGPTQ